MKRTFGENLKTAAYWRFEALRATVDKRIEIIVPAVAFLGIAVWFGAQHLRAPALSPPDSSDIDLLARLKIPQRRRAAVDANALLRRNGREWVVNSIGYRGGTTELGKRELGFMRLGTSMKGAAVSRLEEAEGFPGLISAAESARRLRNRDRLSRRSSVVPAPERRPPSRPRDTDVATTLVPMTQKFVPMLSAQADDGRAVRARKLRDLDLSTAPSSAGDGGLPGPSRNMLFAGMAAALLLVIGGAFGFLRPPREKAAACAPPAATAAAGPAAAPAAQRPMGKYNRLRVLDPNGRRSVWLVRHVQTQQPYVVKPVRAGGEPLSPQGVTTLREKAAQVYSMLHPAIVRVFELLESQNPPLIVQEYMLEDTLSRFLESYKGLGITAARSILAPVCDALSHGHYYGVLHLNLKPSNIFVMKSGGGRVADYRLVEAPPNLSAREADRYGAPELAGGAATILSDVYSLGACLRDILHGGPGMTPAAQALIAKAVSEDPARRPATVQEFQEDLAALK